MDMLVIHIVIQSQSNAMRGLSHQNPADDMHTSNNIKKTAIPLLNMQTMN